MLGNVHDQARCLVVLTHSGPISCYKKMAEKQHTEKYASSPVIPSRFYSFPDYHPICGLVVCAIWTSTTLEIWIKKRYR